LGKLGAALDEAGVSPQEFQSLLTLLQQVERAAEGRKVSSESVLRDLFAWFDKRDKLIGDLRYLDALRDRKERDLEGLSELVVGKRGGSGISPSPVRWRPR
jgi:hypothetical protein